MTLFKKYLYPILVGSFLLSMLLIILFAKKNPPIPSLKDREGTLAASSEWLNTKQVITGLLSTLKMNPENHKAKLQLAEAYMQEARVTGNHPYYDMAALQLLNEVLNKEPENFEALCCKSSVYLSQHHFADALAIAKEAQEVNPDAAFVYGLLTDANVELGYYKDAVEMADKMVSIRPDLKSYSRVSYLREIYGDYKGSIEAMKQAVTAGYPGLEQTEWARVTLGHLYENTGDLLNAEMQYQIALQDRPDYPFAYAGLGRIAKAKKNYLMAASYMEKAKKIIREYSFSDELTDLYRLSNQPARAKINAQEVITMLVGDAESANQNENIGHYADRELAYAYLKTNELDKALEHAEIEYKRRPENIDVCETLAWVHYKRGEFAEANKLINTALRTHSNNPVLLCRAGLIKFKSGETANGIIFVKKSFQINPFLVPDLASEAKPYLVMK